jgi:cysteinyl-tRNA synthetase
VTIHQLLDTGAFGGKNWPGEVVRLVLFKSHYRAPLDFTIHALQEADANIKKWLKAIGEKRPVMPELSDPLLLEALCDDLNTALAFQRLNQMAEDARYDIQKQDYFLENAQALGFMLTEGYFADDKVLSRVDEISINESIKDRLAFIKDKNWAEADRIRDALLENGIQLKDGKDPETGERITTWEVKR